MTLLDLSIKISKLCIQYPQYRHGQAAWNALYDLNPALASKVHGTDADPFYDDSKINAFYAFLAQQGVS